MFKRGGSSYEAQGTGITSPYDTPRRGYADGVTQEEINERRRNLYQDPRGDLSYAVQGFSALASPYKKTGDAKTIGEMLYEGAQDVRGSRAEGRGLEQAAELANIQSEEDILRAKEKHIRDLELIDRQGTSTLLKDPSIPRQVEKEQSGIIKGANANPQNPGSEFDLIYSGGIAQGRVTIRNLQTGEEVITAMVIPSEVFKKVEGVWDFDVGKLAAGMVYWDPTRMRWLIVENAQTGNAKEIYFDTYEEARGGLKVKKSIEQEEKSIVSDPNASDTEIKNNEIKMKITTNLQGVELTDAVVYDEAAKAGIKIVENISGSKTFVKNLADNEMLFATFKRILRDKKTADAIAESSKRHTFLGNESTNVIESITEETDVAELAAGGRAGYALGSPEPQGEELDLATDELNELTSWWKSEVNKNVNS